MSGESPFYAFSSLTTMFKVIYENYKTNLFYLEESAWLDMNLERFAKVCNRYNPEIPYWEMPLKNLSNSNFAVKAVANNPASRIRKNL